MLPKRNVPKLPPVLTTKYCAISPNWADQHSPYLFGLCFVHSRLRPPDKFPPLLKAASLEMKVPGGNWHGYQLWSTFTTLIYEKKKKQAMTFLLSVRSYLELLPPKLFPLQMSISPSWRKFMSDRWSKLNKETQALYAQGNHMRRQNASNFCWQFSHLFFVDFAILLASLGGASSNSEQWSVVWRRFSPCPTRLYIP